MKVLKVKNEKIIMLAFILVILLSFTGCGKKSATSNNSTQYSNVKTEAVMPNGSAQQNSDNAVQKDTSNDSYINVENANTQDRKITKSATLLMETLNFDKTISAIMDNVKQSGAYIESSSVSGNGLKEADSTQNRTAKLVIKVPKQNFDTFLSSSGKTGNVLDTKTVSEDLTSQYFDTEAHLKSLKVQEERLLELLKKSGELKDILQVETELSNVRYKIENLTGTIKKWDNMIDYSSVTIEVNEVQQIRPNPVSLWDNIKANFTNSFDIVVKILKGLLTALIAVVPFIIVLAPIFFIIRYIVKFIIKKKNN